jgi:hypothetical protein
MSRVLSTTRKGIKETWKKLQDIAHAKLRGGMISRKNPLTHPQTEFNSAQHIL